ncbi:MAG: hypothetical protein KF814_03480 [Nitrospiraceae bacterium]|nr:hypothetical protein [Nitrospiraceae bacterium]
MDLRFLSSPSVPAMASLAFLVCSGCSEAVMLTQESSQGGIVTYLYREDRGGPLGTANRRGAVQVMERKCPNGYSVVRDGEVKAYSSVSSIEGQEGESSWHRWGMEFRCK